MLAALEEGVKGGVWFSLIDKVYSPDNLRSAWAKVLRNKGAAGADGVTTTQFLRDAEANLQWLSQQIRSGDYKPQAVRRSHIPKADGGRRPLGIPTVRDRIVQGALRHVIEPIFEREFMPHSYGFRPGKGCKDALRRVDQLLKSGMRYVVDADLKSYFDTIPHDKLMERLRERVADGRVLKLVESFLKANIMEGLEQWTPAAGAPQGAVLSPLLSNIYLNPLDHLVAAAGWEMVRYADDFVILCRTEQEARQALQAVEAWAAQAGLTLHPTKTRVVDAQAGAFEFLGYRFDRGYKTPRAKSLLKLRDAIRPKTRRTDGRAFHVVIDDVNRTLRGWFEYFKHSHRNSFARVDMWVRGRLRSLLRHRHKKPGKAKGRDHRRWPNAYFAQVGLMSLHEAHRLACQSMKMAH
jgi:RNA-directed DNA polymerase